MKRIIHCILLQNDTMELITVKGLLMQERSFLPSHIGSEKEITEIINKFHWNISCEKSGNLWIVKGGEKVLLRTDSHESLDAFLYGMALAYSVLPQSTVEHFAEQFDFE